MSVLLGSLHFNPSQVIKAIRSTYDIHAEVRYQVEKLVDRDVFRTFAFILYRHEKIFDDMCDSLEEFHSLEEVVDEL